MELATPLAKGLEIAIKSLEVLSDQRKGGKMESKPTILSFLLGVSVTLGFFLLVAASSPEDNGRYQLTVEGGAFQVTDTRTGTVKTVLENGTAVMHWDTHYVKREIHLSKP